MLDDHTFFVHSVDLLFVVLPCLETLQFHCGGHDTPQSEGLRLESDIFGLLKAVQLAFQSMLDELLQDVLLNELVLAKLVVGQLKRKALS